MDVLSGSVFTDEGIINGYLCIEDGMVVAIEEGMPPDKPLVKGLISAPMVNAHTHCADAGLKISAGMTIEELVAPPDGLKHIYLNNLSISALENNIKNYSKVSSKNGICTFIDFREGGEEGCRALRKIVPDSIILGRPLNKEYDHNEITRILKVANGIGITSISDIDYKYVEKVADQTRNEGKIFAIHASERIREDIDKILSLDPTFIVHMTEATDSDILKCAEMEIPIVICARSNLYFGKTPPIKRIIDCGADVAIGTDNGMFGDPDMRLEASVFKEVLVSQGGSEYDIIGPMLKEGRKILYPYNKIHVSVGMPADLIVLPYSGEFSIGRILNGKDPVFKYEPGRK